MRYAAEQATDEAALLRVVAARVDDYIENGAATVPSPGSMLDMLERVLPTAPDLVQIQNPRSGNMVTVDRTTGRIVDHGDTEAVA